VYEITSVNYTDNNTASITGNLTVKSTTVPVTITALVRSSDEKGFFAQSFVNLDRTVLGINYGLGNVSKDVELAIHIFAK
jgi:polyisoprenoid-binding protein YceI